MSDDPDRGLVEAASRGDRDAFELLVRRCQPLLSRYLLHLVGDAALSDELTQVTLIKMHAALGAFRGESNFTTWLLRIARHAAFDDRRASARRRRREEEASTVRVSPDPSVLGEVNYALASLPVAVREPLLLVEVFGLTYAEAGTLLGVPEGTVKSRVHRARRRISRWYVEEEARPG